jgi:hypothetical protein
MPGGFNDFYPFFFQNLHVNIVVHLPHGGKQIDVNRKRFVGQFSDTIDGICKGGYLVPSILVIFVSIMSVSLDFF